jgi:hypothetical protein
MDEVFDKNQLDRVFSSRLPGGFAAAERFEMRLGAPRRPTHRRQISDRSILGRRSPVDAPVGRRPVKGDPAMGPLTIEPAEGDLAAACACCAGEPGARGFVYESRKARAVYFIEPIGAPKYPMIKLGIAIGEWSSGAQASERTCFAFICKPTEAGPILEATELQMSGFPELAVLGRGLAAAELRAHSELPRFSMIAKAIIAEDWRLEPIRGSGASSATPARRFFAEPT